jgi:hypothetical protein
MKRTFHLLGQAVPLVLLWAAIVEIGFRMQQYFGPLYDLDMASIKSELGIRCREPSADTGTKRSWCLA